ncbi:hypothetical protein RND71_023190 [Anisodus tanguticus]|uniref:Magnesium transporter n=1 Tax=Anisodus tanguticus TaxID=243964 RepID=A0AAE1VEJ0_9SOLA|nr:hypothetical protein RND71_023190 [Anisodus tanguticus]
MCKGMSSDNIKGLILALSSSIFIGASFIVKKKGLKKAGASGVRAGTFLCNGVLCDCSGRRSSGGWRTEGVEAEGGEEVVWWWLWRGSPEPGGQSSGGGGVFGGGFGC